MTSLPTVACLAAALVCAALPAGAGEPIDRKAWVSRHDVHLDQADPFAPLSVGNGSFCFTADVTGLQTFESHYEKAIPLGTMADWAWHSFPAPEGCNLEETFEAIEGPDRTATYPLKMKTASTNWLRGNPHRFSLARVGLMLMHEHATEATLEDIREIDQTLELWQGQLVSRFTFDGTPVTVWTCVDQEQDALSVRIHSSLVAEGELGVRISFPYPTGGWGPAFNDWDKAERHTTRVVDPDGPLTRFHRTIDDTTYLCTMMRSDNRPLIQESPHSWVILGGNARDTIEVGLGFSPDRDHPAPANPVDMTLSTAGLPFWREGGVIDLSGSSDPRWFELERRIVLSRYLMGIQGTGRYPNAETGLTCNSWHGKFHLEMHWWHAAHFPLWGQPEVLARQLAWYREALPMARATAARQGYDGVRWPKMVGPDGRESPSGIGPLLIWQQPHPIYYAEMLRRAEGAAAVAKWQDLVFETARFMASFARWDEAHQCFTLGPPLLSAREFGTGQYKETVNPAFELAYWRWGLDTANAWREAAGLPRESGWDRIALNLAPLPVHEGVYVEQEAPLVPDGGHPCMLAAWGVLPMSDAVDPATMTRTLDHVMDAWQWGSTWGWDYPTIAMTAARAGRPGTAIDALLLDVQKNRYLPNGHNFQRDGLPIYLPGNGGLLTATAMMAAGWDGAPDRPAPGFPEEGWTVRWEGLEPMP